MCDCDMWRSLERIGELVARLEADGFIAHDDAEDAIAAVVSQAECWGFLPRHAGSIVRNHSRFTTEEKERILDEYIAFASEARRSPRALAEKRRSYGVTNRQLTHWARNLRGPKTLQDAPPRSACAHIRELLSDGRWMGRRAFVAAGVKRTSIPGAIHWLSINGRLDVRRGEDGMLEYALREDTGLDARADKAPGGVRRRGGRAA